MEFTTHDTPNARRPIVPGFNDDFSIKLDIEREEIDLQDLRFKTVGTGLGFHHERKTLQTLKNRQQEQKPFYVPKAHEQEIAFPFANIIPKEKIEKKVEVVEYEDALLPAQFAAWTIDVFIVSALTAATFFFFAVLSGIPFHVLRHLIPVLDLVAYSGIIFSIFYMGYFSILDLSVTPGKSLLGIRLARFNGKRMKIKQTFARAFITFTSFVVLGLPLFLDFQGRLSETRMIKRK